MTIVVVDDDLFARESLTTMLEGEGARVVAACDAEEGVEAVLHAMPDAVVCDLELPAMDGFYLVQRMRDDEIRERRTPAVAIAITGHTDDTYRLRSIGEGFHHFLTKPASAERLVCLLVEAVGAREFG